MSVYSHYTQHLTLYSQRRYKWEGEERRETLIVIDLFLG